MLSPQVLSTISVSMLRVCLLSSNDGSVRLSVNRRIWQTAQSPTHLRWFKLAAPPVEFLALGWRQDFDGSTTWYGQAKPGFLGSVLRGGSFSALRSCGPSCAEDDDPVG
jgi:hypothetical protein